jgi:hypothetical protein
MAENDSLVSSSSASHHYTDHVSPEEVHADPSPAQGEGQDVASAGTGPFPREVMNCCLLLPLEEEGRLNDLPLREDCGRLATLRSVRSGVTVGHRQAPGS